MVKEGYSVTAFRGDFVVVTIHFLADAKAKHLTSSLVHSSHNLVFKASVVVAAAATAIAHVDVPYFDSEDIALVILVP